MAQRVVITGLGVVSGLGLGAEALWAGLVEGRSAIGPIRQFDASAFPIPYAAEVDASLSVRDFVPKSYRKGIKVMCRDIELAVIGAAKAVADAGLTTKGTDSGEPTFAPNRVGCQIGAGLIVADINELTAAFAKARNEDGSFSMAKWGESGMHELTPLWLLKYLPNMLACHVTIIHDCRGPSNTITCAEASGALCIGESRRVIERGDADACFTGGAETKINPLGLLRQAHTGMMHCSGFESEPEPRTPNPELRSLLRPFGRAAIGSLPGAAAAILVIESEEAAQRRSATVYAEIAGFGASQGADASTCPPGPQASGAALSAAIGAALRDAGIDANAIDAIVPLGCGESRYDASEAAALRVVFGKRLTAISLVTTKPNIGLCAAAASAVDVAVGAMCLRHQMLPARINGDSPLEGLDAGPAEAREARLEHVLVCGTGFGGQNYAVVLRRFQE